MWKGKPYRKNHNVKIKCVSKQDENEKWVSRIMRPERGRNFGKSKEISNEISAAPWPPENTKQKKKETKEELENKRRKHDKKSRT